MSAENRKRFAAVVGVAAAGMLLAIVPRFEGTASKSYADPIGLVTVCTGHQADGIEHGRTYTAEECERLLVSDLLAHNAAIDRCVHVPLAPYQRAAFVSFAFNVGGVKFCSSTLVRKLNVRDYAGACAELSRWTRAAGKELPGLVARRKSERLLCEGHVEVAR